MKYEKTIPRWLLLAVATLHGLMSILRILVIANGSNTTLGTVLSWCVGVGVILISIRHHKSRVIPRVVLGALLLIAILQPKLIDPVAMFFLALATSFLLIAFAASSATPADDVN